MSGVPWSLPRSSRSAPAVARGRPALPGAPSGTVIRAEDRNRGVFATVFWLSASEDQFRLLNPKGIYWGEVVKPGLGRTVAQAVLRNPGSL